MPEWGEVCREEEVRIRRLGKAHWVGLSGSEPRTTEQSHPTGSSLTPPHKGISLRSPYERGTFTMCIPKWHFKHEL